ncbi:hypothetical protein D8B26_001265 [Coccidioides posadasii str. Silveira]|nr:hypothetical protein D8B26_001265 [Coccidioides posadasii str. Silveira]
MASISILYPLHLKALRDIRDLPALALHGTLRFQHTLPSLACAGLVALIARTQHRAFPLPANRLAKLRISLFTGLMVSLHYRSVPPTVLHFSFDTTMLLFTIIFSVLTIWGTIVPIPHTDVHPQESFGRRFLSTFKPAFMVRGTLEGIELVVWLFDPDPCSVFPWRRRALRLAREAELARLEALHSLHYLHDFDLDSAAMQVAPVPNPTRTLPVPSRVVRVESESPAITSRTDFGFKWGQVICIVVALVSSLVSGLSFVLFQAEELTSNLGSRSKVDRRRVSVAVRASSGDLTVGFTTGLDSVADFIGLSALPSMSTESLVEDSPVESSTNADGNRYTDWELVPYTDKPLRGVVPVIIVPKSTPEGTEGQPLVEQREKPALSGGLTFNPFVLQELDRHFWATLRAQQQLYPPAQPQGVMASSAESTLSTTTDSAPVPEEPVGPPAVVSSKELSHAVPPVEEQRQEPSEAPVEVPATTVEEPNSPPESAVAVTVTVPGSGNDNGNEAMLPKEERQKDGPQTESLGEAGEAGPAKPSSRNRPSKKTRRRRARARLLDAQDEAIRKAEEQIRVSSTSAGQS